MLKQVMFEDIKRQFPILNNHLAGKEIVYLDSAASSQNPGCVIDAVSDYYRSFHSNVHRGAHALSRKATEIYETAREKVQHFVHAKHRHEIIFTKGTTESINLVAATFGRQFLRQGDEVMVSEMEHHSNIVPWQLAADAVGAVIKVIPVDDSGELVWDVYQNLFSEKTKMVALTHVSNVLGTVNPIRKIVETAHRFNVPVLIDGAQGIKSEIVNVQEIDCDFYCFSGHKLYAPMGIGVLYGKEKWLDQLPPYQGGGNMIERVGFQETRFNELPFKFEAGTPNVGAAAGLTAAVDFVQRHGLSCLIAHDHALLEYATEQINTVEGIRILGTSPYKAGVLSFLLSDFHPADVGALLDLMGIAVRAGHHCAQPLMERYGIKGTVRASFGIYNTLQDVDKLMQALAKVKQML
jgi:cysteine desulfurase/selenocysteine lyase